MYTRFQKNTDEALAKYNLQVVDSMKKVQSINELKPEFILTPAEPNRQFVFLSNEYGKDILNITFKSVNTTTYNIDLTIYILATNEALYDTLTAFVILKKFAKLNFRKSFVTGVNSTLTLPINHEWLAKENGIIIITGSFSSDYQNRNRTPIYIGINFNFKENKMANIISDEGVIDFLKSMKECN